MDPEEKMSRGNVDDVMVVLSRLSKSEQLRYTPRFKAFVNLQMKRQRACHARRQTGRSTKEKKPRSKHSKGKEEPIKESKQKMCKKCGKGTGGQSFWSRISMQAPKDKCCCKKPRRPCKRRRCRPGCRSRKTRACRRRPKRKSCRKRRKCRR